MNTLIVIFAIIAIAAASIGIRFNKLWHWVFVLFGFLSGFLFGFGLPQDKIVHNIYTGLFLGFCSAIFVLLVGRFEYRRNQNTKARWRKLFPKTDV